MRKTRAVLLSVVLLRAVAVVGLVGPACNPTLDLPPIPLTLELGSSDSFGESIEGFQLGLTVSSGDSFGEFPLPEGEAFEDLEATAIEIPSMPAEDELDAMIRDELDEFEVEQLDITGMNLVSITLEPTTQSSFGFLDEIEVYYVPKPVQGQPQEPILLGRAASQTGFDDTPVLTPPEPVDFLELIRVNDANPAPGAPEYYTVIDGSVPSGSPVWDTIVTVEPAGNVAIETPRMEVCDLPSEADLKEIIRDAAGDVVAGIFTITRMDVRALLLNATEGDFSDFNRITLYYVPKPVDGVNQPPVVIGTAEATGVFGTQVSLEPPEPVDFLELIRANDANTGPGCSGIYISVSGEIPDETPTWDTDISLDVYTRLGVSG